MAKRRTVKKPKKKKKRASASRGSGLPVKVILVGIICGALIAGSTYGIWYFFTNSRFFAVKEIVVNKDRDYSFWKGESRLKKLYKGRNIFEVDLKQVRTVIKSDYPQLRKVEVRRRMPDTIEVDIISRLPAAVIDTAGGIVIDSEGIVLSIGQTKGTLVKIKGLNFFINTPSRGDKVDNRSLAQALVLLDGLNKKMSGYKKQIEYIDISDRKNIVLGISGVIVKMGTDDFSEKIVELKKVMSDPKMKMEDIKYIDLRFGAPAVISLKKK
ncbi:MAG: cell division protein FtsQ/DivIB [Candidatus Tantalella remota]|nr:cell division protein FtsQ/DivIB [Candidatus Tantalella remota]